MIEEVETLARAAGILYRKRHREASQMVLALATDIVLKQGPDEQSAWMANLDRAYKKGRES